MALSDIQGWRNAYEDKPDEELIQVMHELVPHCAQHIAAKQVFEARRSTVIQDGNGIQRDTRKLTHWILWLTVAILLLTLFQVFSPFFRGEKSVQPPHTEEKAETQ